MKRFLRGVLLFLQCLLTWPWAMPLAFCIMLKYGWIEHKCGGRMRDVWKIATLTAKADLQMRLAWVRTGE